jgi:heme exporter protein B
VFRDALVIATKDLMVEWRSRTTLGQVAPLGLLVLVVFAFAFDANATLLEAGGPGLFWVAVLFGGVLVIQRTFAVESDDGNRDALLLSGLQPGGIFLGKLVGIAIQLLVLEVVVFVGVIVFFENSVDDVALLIGAALAGTAAFSAAGALIGALSMGVRLRDTLLPLLLIPVLAPILLAGTRAFESAFGVSTVAGWNWTGLLCVIAAVYTAIGLVAFGPLLEDG